MVALLDRSWRSYPIFLRCHGRDHEYAEMALSQASRRLWRGGWFTRSNQSFGRSSISWPQGEDSDRDHDVEAATSLVQNVEKEDQNRYDTFATKVKSSLDPLAPRKFSHLHITKINTSRQNPGHSCFTTKLLLLVKARVLNSQEPSRHKLVTSSQAYPLILLLAKTPSPPLVDLLLGFGINPLGI
ncbi:hypothetical protein YC2023_058706 [Brassica napus]